MLPSGLPRRSLPREMFLREFALLAREFLLRESVVQPFALLLHAGTWRRTVPSINTTFCCLCIYFHIFIHLFLWIYVSFIIYIYTLYILFVPICVLYIYTHIYNIYMYIYNNNNYYLCTIYMYFFRVSFVMASFIFIPGGPPRRSSFRYRLVMYCKLFLIYSFCYFNVSLYNNIIR